MYSLTMMVLMAGAVAAAPAAENLPQAATPKPVLIVKQVFDNNFDGTFTSEFETEDGFVSKTSGQLKEFSPEVKGQVMQGEYSYIAPDGTPIITKWYADERGFHAEGSHLPTPPPVPEAIARALAFLESLPPQPAPASETR